VNTVVNKNTNKYKTNKKLISGTGNLDISIRPHNRDNKVTNNVIGSQ